MSRTIEFGAFVQDASANRLASAQRVARDLGVTVQADGSLFAGGPGGPVRVTVNVPDGTALTTDHIKQGRDAFDDLLSGTERLTDYAVVKDDGVVTGVVSLLTAESKSVGRPVQRTGSPDAAPTPPRRRRWSPFR